MIVYSGTLKQFSNDVLMGIIAERIEECFALNGFNHHNDAEYRAFNNSLMVMNNTKAYTLLLNIKSPSLLREWIF